VNIRFAALVIGLLFGFVLAWSRVVEYDTIHSMLLLQDFTVFLLMGSAIAVGALGYRLLRWSGARSLLDGSPVSWSRTTPTRSHVLGSALFGAGWALAGTCPGPVLAQLGSGHLAAVFTLTGLLAGVHLRGIVSRRATASAPPVAAIGF
jgi:uncharacterized protein